MVINSQIKRRTKIIEYMDHDYIEGLFSLGGEPLEPKNQEGLLPLVKDIKRKISRQKYLVLYWF